MIAAGQRIAGRTGAFVVRVGDREAIEEWRERFAGDLTLMVVERTRAGRIVYRLQASGSVVRRECDVRRGIGIVDGNEIAGRQTVAIPGRR